MCWYLQRTFMKCLLLVYIATLLRFYSFFFLFYEEKELRKLWWLLLHFLSKKKIKYEREKKKEIIFESVLQGKLLNVGIICSGFKLFVNLFKKWG